MSHTKARVLQYIAIILITATAGGGYWYWKNAQASVSLKAADKTGLVGYWSFDEGSGTSAGDASGNGNTGTLTNGPTWTSGKLEGGLNFDGVDDYVGTSNVKNIGVGFSGTVSFWAKGSGVPISNERTIEATQGDGEIIVNSDGSLTYSVDSNGSSPYTYALTNTTTANTGNWNFYVLNLSVPSSSGTLSGTLYVNGIQQVLTNTSYVVSGAISSYANIDIGRWRNFTYSTSYFTGSIDEVRIYDRVLGSAEIANLYALGAAKLNTSQNSSLTNGLVGLWSFDGADVSGTTAYDRSGSANNGTLTNGPTATIGKVGQGMSFDGVDDYVSTLDQSYFSPSVNDITVSFWARIPATAVPGDNNSCGTAGDYLVTKGRASQWEWAFENDGNDRACFSTWQLGGTVHSRVQVLRTMNDGQWHHYVGTIDYLVQQTFYIDGVEAINSTSFTGVMGNGTQPVEIGQRGDGNYGNANIDEVRIYNRALTATEIQSLYALGDPDKINASQNTQSTSGLVGLWSFNGPDLSGTTAYDRSGSGNNGTLTNGPTATIGKVGQGMSFDGVNQRISLPGMNLANITVSAWVKGASTAGIGLFSRWTGGGASTDSIITTIGTNNKFSVAWRSSSDYGTAVSTNTINSTGWAHVVATYNGTSWVFYSNGSVLGTTVTKASPGNISTSATGNMYIGFANGGYYGGSIDETRVYNRALTATEVTTLYDLGR